MSESLFPDLGGSDLPADSFEKDKSNRRGEIKS